MEGFPLCLLAAAHCPTGRRKDFVGPLGKQRVIHFDRTIRIDNSTY